MTLTRTVRFAAGMMVASLACAGSDPTAIEVVSLVFVDGGADGVVAGQSFRVAVELRGPDGARATTARDAVTVTISAGYSLIGPTSVSATRGLATFNGLMLTTAGDDAMLTASAGGMNVTSNVFVVAPGAPDLLQSTIEPDGVVSVPANESVAMTYTLRDAFGNAVASSPVTFTTPLAGAAFSPASGVTSETGTFSTAFRATGPGAAPISVTSGANTVILRPQFSVCGDVPITVPGSLSGSINAGECFAASRSHAIFGFARPSSGGVALTVTSAFTPTLEIKSEPPGENIVVAATSGSPVEWLVPAGTFQARVGAPSAAGTFTLATSAVLANYGCVRRFLTASGTFHNQALFSGDCTFDDASYYDSFGVYSSRPCTIRLESSAFTRYLWLYDDAGAWTGTAAVAEDPGQAAQLGLPSCRYLGKPIDLRVNALPGESGGYTLTVTFFGEPPEVISGAAPPIGASASTPALRAAPNAGAIAEMRRALRAKNRP